MEKIKTVGIVPAFKQTTKIYPKLFAYWPALVALHIVSYLISEFLSWEQESIFNSGKEDLLSIFAVFTASTIADVALTTAWIILVAKVIQFLTHGGSSKEFLTDLNHALIEGTRALARMLRWLPLLIIPAAVKFVRLTFVPFVVADCDAYKRGEIDALDESEKLVSKRFWLVLFALVLSTLVPALPSLIYQGENISLASRPLASVTLSVFEFFTGLFATAFLFCLYRQLAEAGQKKG